jgi:hypothetical protein
LIQQVVVLLISSQIKISKSCLLDVLLVFILADDQGVSSFLTFKNSKGRYTLFLFWP